MHTSNFTVHKLVGLTVGSQKLTFRILVNVVAVAAIFLLTLRNMLGETQQRVTKYVELGFRQTMSAKNQSVTALLQ